MDAPEMLERIRELAGTEVKNGTSDCVHRKKVQVTQGRHTNTEGKSVITVQEPFGDAFDVPYVPALMYTEPGDKVWIEWVYGFSNACAVNSGAWQKTDLPTCVVPTEDGLVIQVNYNDVMVVGNDGVTINTDTLTVSGSIIGNVVNTQAAKTVTVSGRIQDALDNLGKHLTGDVTVTVPAGTYVEDPDIEGFEGSGKLTIEFASGATLKGNTSIRGCRSVELTGGTVLGVDGYDCITADAVTYCEINGMAISGCERSGTAKQEHGVTAMNGSYVKVIDTQIERFDTAVYVQHAHADVINCRGGINSTDASTVANLVDGIVINEDGGSVNARGTIPMGTDASGSGYTDNGYTFCKGGGVEPVPTVSDGEAPIVTEVTSTWTANNGYTTKGVFAETTSTACDGWAAGTPKTGVYSETSTYYYMAGMWILDGAASIATTLSGATISKATVTITRLTSGSSSSISVSLCGHSLESVSGQTESCDPFRVTASGQEIYTEELTSADMERGDTTTFVLPSSAYTGLQDGTIKGFMVSSVYNQESLRFEQYKCDLSVTYTTA